MENDYLPQVLKCEAAHSADLEALKALAVAARSVTYFAMSTDGSICDSQGCQVYGCGRDPDPIHEQAVRETQGVYLMSHDTLTYGFYVAGDSTPNASCVGNSGSTEHWVTYNEGKSGTAVEQTRLGWRHNADGSRLPARTAGASPSGARSAWRSRASGGGRILAFYYGADIEIVQAAGECIDPIEDDEHDHPCEDDDEPLSPRVDEDEPMRPPGDEPYGEHGCRVGTPGSFAVLWLLLLAVRRRRY